MVRLPDRLAEEMSAIWEGRRAIVGDERALKTSRALLPEKLQVEVFVICKRSLLEGKGVDEMRAAPPPRGVLEGHSLNAFYSVRRDQGRLRCLDAKGRGSVGPNEGSDQHATWDSRCMNITTSTRLCRAGHLRKSGKPLLSCVGDPSFRGEQKLPNNSGSTNLG